MLHQVDCFYLDIEALAAVSGTSITRQAENFDIIGG